MIIIFILFSITLIPSPSHQTRINFLKVVHRFNSTTFDYYFSCNTCSYTLQWHISGQSAGSHDVHSSVGNVVFSRDENHTGLQYSSLLLSSQQIASNRACMDAVLIITRSVFQHIQVSCRGDVEEAIHNSLIDLEYVEENENQGDVQIQYVLSQPDIIKYPTAGSSTFLTYFFICLAQTTQNWVIDGDSAGGFNGPDIIGDAVFESFSDYPSVLYRQTILMKRSASSDLTALLVVSVMNSTSNMTIRCRGREYFVDIVFRMQSNGLDSTIMQTPTTIMQESITTNATMPSKTTNATMPSKTTNATMPSKTTNATMPSKTIFTANEMVQSSSIGKIGFNVLIVFAFS